MADLINELSVPRAYRIFQRKDIPTDCPVGTLVGDAVYITGPIIAGRYQVATADPSNPAKMPAIGVVYSKPTGTTAKVRILGELPNIITGLTIGQPVYVGAAGQPSSTAGTIGQEIGFVLSPDIFFVQPGSLSAGGVDTLMFGADSVGASATTRYLYAGYSDGLAEVDPHFWTAPRNCTLKNLYIRHDAPDGNGNAIVYRIRVNTVATLLSVSIASTAFTASNLVQLIPIMAGDAVDVQVVKVLGIGSSPQNVKATLEVA